MFWGVPRDGCLQLFTTGQEKTERGEARQRCVGDRSGEGLPGPISNPVVKLTSAEGTARVTVWERTSSPTHLCLASSRSDTQFHIKHQTSDEDTLCPPSLVLILADAHRATGDLPRQHQSLAAAATGRRGESLTLTTPIPDRMSAAPTSSLQSMISFRTTAPSTSATAGVTYVTMLAREAPSC